MEATCDGFPMFRAKIRGEIVDTSLPGPGLKGSIALKAEEMLEAIVHAGIEVQKIGKAHAG